MTPLSNWISLVTNQFHSPIRLRPANLSAIFAFEHPNLTQSYANQQTTEAMKTEFRRSKICATSRSAEFQPFTLDILRPVVLALSLFAVPSLRAQLVNDGATNTLSNVTTNITGDVTVGTNGPFTLLVLSDNALLTNSLNGIIGRFAAAKSNEVQLISPTARWRMGGNLSVGSNGAMSRLVVSNGGFVENFIGSRDVSDDTTLLLLRRSE